MIDTENVKEQWMPCPLVEREYPGLTYIYALDKIIVTNKLDALHEVIGVNGNCYTIYNNQKQKIFLAVQETPERKYIIKIFNKYGNEVIQVKKHGGFCVNRVLVFAPPGNFVGSVEKLLTCLNAFRVKNHTGEVFLQVKPRHRSCSKYDILSNNNTIGLMTKNDDCTKSENQSISATFPVEMEIGQKAVLIGACFLIGF
ncbi:phospholipid scramblase 2-like [Papilio machaon]|uniref:phospholipid scramblase 2-like n=1 Tax=Papilio machaon TaxID=76193 RepID=UPI001E665D5A|nr:phospholipid scramblase 2-like [Papilio machaon]